MARAAKQSERAPEAVFSEALLSALPDGVITYALDGQCRSANQAAADLLGVPVEHLLAQNFREISSWKDSTLLARAEETMRTGSSQHWETHFTSTAGKTLWLDFRLERVDLAGERTLILIFADISERKRIEDSLRLAQFSLDHAADVVLWSDSEGRFCEVSGSACQRLGYSRDELLHMSIFDITPERTREGWSSRWEEIKSRQSFSFEAEHQTKSGEIFPVEITVNYVKYGDQEFNCSFARDITERKQAEELLKDEISRRRILVEQSRDGIVVLDQTGKVCETNQEYARMLGYSMEEMSQLYIWDWNVDQTKEQLLEILRVVDTTGDHFETRSKRKDGTLCEVEISTNAALFGDEKYVFCVCRDITERKQAEEALRLTQLSVDGAGDLIHWIDREGHLLYVSDSTCRCHGYSREELLGLTVFDLDPSQSPEAWQKHWRELKEHGSLVLESVHRTKAGELFPLELTVNYVECGGREYNFSFGRDISERKRAEQELHEAKAASDAQNRELEKTGRRLKETNRKLLKARNALALQARTDPLTGCLNRRAVLSRLEEELERGRRGGGSLAVGMIDIDHFKKINDTYGHPAGDQVLSEVVARALGALRPYDVFGRFGGEEFLVVILGAGGDEVRSALGRIRVAIASDPVAIDAWKVPVRVSIGGVLWGKESAVDLIRSADEALYRAKALGRNRLVMRESGGRPSELLAGCRRASGSG